MKNSILVGLSTGVLISFSLISEALPHRKALDRKSGQYLSEGVFIGGRAGRGFSLLDVRRSFDKKAQAERVVLDWGDANGAPLKGNIGFFHVGIDEQNKRVVVDLSQVIRAGLDERQVQARFKSSPLVKESQLIFDPVGSSTQLVLGFNTQVAVEVFYLADDKETSRLVLDMRPLQTSGK